LFPNRTAPDVPPGIPVVEDVGPNCDDLGDVVLGPPKSPLLGFVLAALLIPLKKLDGSPVGGDCGYSVVALSVGPLGTTVPDSVTVGTLSGNPYVAHSSAKSMPIRQTALQEGRALCTTGNEMRVKHG